MLNAVKGYGELKMVKLTNKSPYTVKDQAKSDKATQFIGIGAIGSSTHQYAKDWGDKANTGEYSSEDIVFISINGKRSNRKGFEYIKDLVDKAIEADAKFVTDNEYHRNRDFNIGERVVAHYLRLNGYEEIDAGFWSKKQQTNLRKQSMFKQFNPKQYLAIDIANHYGLDKLNYEDRIDWVKAHYDTLEELTQKAEEPILYAKAVNALRMTDKGMPTGHTVALDSASSGLQLMSLLTNCESGMRLTGLIDPDNRMDAYTHITKAINAKLKDNPDIESLYITRKDAKQGIMTHLYGSKRVPEAVFADALPIFYQTMYEQCKGASMLLDLLLTSWSTHRDSYIWTMPDNHTVYLPVMVHNESRIRIPQLNYTASAVYYTQGTKDEGLSNAANFVHSVDAYVLRSLVRRCNYDKDKLLKFKQLNTNTPPTTYESHHWVNTRYKACKIADISMIYALDAHDLPMINQELREVLDALCDHVLEYEPFEVVTVHDSFACHPNHVQRLRQQYNEVLATIYQSDLLKDLLSQLFQDDVDIELGERTLTDTIKNSNYGIC